MRTGLLASFLLLCACAGPHLTAVTPAGGIVSSYGWEPNGALQVAQAHCVQFGKSAVITSENDLQDHMTFQCV